MMLTENNVPYLPDYQTFDDRIAALDLPMSSSELHGVMCGYICAGAADDGEMYLRALVVNKKKDESIKQAMLALYEVFAISQQQFSALQLTVQFLLPADHISIIDRAQAFSEWCEGFIQGISMAGVRPDEFHDDDLDEAFEHLHEFAQLDYESLDVSEEDEKSLMDVSEYARMVVIRLYEDLQSNPLKPAADPEHH